jgi:hypothetical protein
MNPSSSKSKLPDCRRSRPGFYWIVKWIIVAFLIVANTAMFFMNSGGHHEALDTRRSQAAVRSLHPRKGDEHNMLCSETCRDLICPTFSTLTFSTLLLRNMF